MLSRRSLVTAGSAGVLVSAGLSGCAPVAAPGSVRIANASGGLVLTMTELMRQQRFLESFGLHPVIQSVADGSRILGGVVGGSLDGSFMSGFSQLFPAVSRGADLKVIGGAILLPTLAVFTAKSAVRTLKDLEGGTVGSGSVGALTYQLTVTLLKANGVDVSKVTFVNIGSSADVFRAVAAGSIDAGVGQAAQAAAGSSVRVLPHGDMAKELPQFTYAGAWASGRAIASKRDILVRALAAHAKLYRFVQQPDSREAFLAARRKVFPAALAVEHEAEWDFIQLHKPFAPDLVLDDGRIDYLQAKNVSFGVQPTVLPIARVADMSLARDALKLLG